MMQALNPKDSSVLVVEDNPDDGVLVARSLETFGIKKVYAAETGEDAIALLREHPCDVALVDYNLPGMNGLRLLERIRESWPATTVVLVTGARDEQIAVSAMKAGAADYVTKDELLTSSIIRTLQAALRQQIASTEEQQRDALASGAIEVEGSLQEAEWLLAPFHESSGHHTRGGPRGAAYGDEGLDALRDAFARYLRETFQLFPESPREREDALVRMFVERGSSPDEMIAFYRAALRSLLLDDVTPPMNPVLCLTRVLALLIEQYQVRQSVLVATGSS